MEAIAAGEIEVGFVNHYYLFLLKEEQPDAPVANHYLAGGDPGALVNVAGAGIVAGSDDLGAAQRFVEFLLSDEGQRFYSDRAEEAEYPLVDGIEPKEGLPPLDSLEGPDISLGELGAELESTLELLNEVGLTSTWAVEQQRRSSGLLIAGKGGRRCCSSRPPRFRRRSLAPSRLPGDPRRRRRRRRLERARPARHRRASAQHLALVLAVTAASVVIGVGLAWLVTRTDLPGRRAFAVAVALPLVIPSYVAALALLGAFGPRGLLQQLLSGLFGVERIPEIYGFPGAMFALTLSTYPYVYLLTAVALRNLDPALEEAALGLGRSRRSTFFRVTLPVIRPSVVAGALLVALYTLSDFGAVSLMQYDALTRAIYLQYRALFDRTPAAVLALVLVALTAILLLEARSRRGRRYHPLGPGAAGRRVRSRSADGAGRRLPTVFLRRRVPPRTARRARVLAGSRRLARTRSRPVWRPALNSIWVSLAAAGCAAPPLAGRAPRPCYPARWTAALERPAYTSNALPGIVIALSLVFFGARYGGPVYQTLGCCSSPTSSASSPSLSPGRAPRSPR